ncbi:unnamed protein product [Urochloa decumbens]|uniref:F-box domain-containing protein n=1 Tax=Urochloa decumbens TaxID=240449 RepID=A0ABC8YD81_9POAL
MFKSASDYIRKPIYVKDIAYDQFQLWLILLCRAISGCIYCKSIYRKGIPLDQFVNLPEDVQHIILSKLPLKEAVQTSILSSKWRSLWTLYPKLRFDGTVMFGKKMNGKQREQYARQFIDTVNAVLQQCQGKVVEELVIKFGFDNLLMDHLNNWVRFAAASHTKFLSFVLTPRDLEALGNPQYIFPFQLLENRSIFSLQLHFVSVMLPTQFCGFPKLRKLDLREVKFNSLLGFFYADGANIRRFEHRHKHLKVVCVTGFKASNGQIEFLVHIVENAPALEVLTVDQSDKLVKNEPLLVKKKVGKYMDGAVYADVRRYIEGTVSSKCCLRLLF